MDDPVPTAPAAMSGVKGAIASLETGAETGAKSIAMRGEAFAKSFYETHLPLFAAVGGAAIGALAMLMKLKL
jgi:hypothetical protein